jgi:hypothetical protein
MQEEKEVVLTNEIVRSFASAKIMRGDHVK